MQFCIGTIKDDFLGLIGDPGGATWVASHLWTRYEEGRLSKSFSAVDLVYKKFTRYFWNKLRHLNIMGKMET